MHAQTLAVLLPSLRIQVNIRGTSVQDEQTRHQLQTFVPVPSFTWAETNTLSQPKKFPHSLCGTRELSDRCNYDRFFASDFRPFFGEPAPCGLWTRMAASGGRVNGRPQPRLALGTLGGFSKEKNSSEFSPLRLLSTWRWRGHILDNAHGRTMHKLAKSHSLDCALSNSSVTKVTCLKKCIACLDK